MLALDVHSAEPPSAAREAKGRPAGQLDLDPMLQAVLKKHPHMPGLVAAIVDGERITALGAVGLRKAGSPVKFELHDLIHLGSCTKAMTGLLIGKLIEEKRLRFESTMGDVFPNMRPKMNAEFEKVTIRQLLRHLGGLPPNLDWDKLDRSGKSIVEQRRMAVEEALGKPPENPPGTKYVYSNVSFVILGAVIETKTGKPWEDVIENEIFTPLSMKTAGFGPPGIPGKIDQPWGHVIKDNKLEPSQSDNPPVMGPAGRVHCSITDWAKFVRQYLDADARKTPLLRSETIRELTAPAPGKDYAGGWIVAKRDWAGGEALNHAGSNTMWYCIVWASPRRDFAILIATNAAGEGIDKGCDDLAGELIKLHADRNK